MTPYMSGRSLRSVDAALPVVPRSRLVTKGDWAFAVRASDFGTLTASLASFKCLLKTFLYRKAFMNS